MTEKIQISLTPLQANAVQVALDTYIEMQSEDPDPDFSRLLVTANEALKSVSRAFETQEHDPIKNFKQYVWGFYGKGGIYEFDCPRDRILKACDIASKHYNFEGDSIDRENVREILQKWGYHENSGFKTR